MGNGWMCFPPSWKLLFLFRNLIVQSFIFQHMYCKYWINLLAFGVVISGSRVCYHSPTLPSISPTENLQLRLPSRAEKRWGRDVRILRRFRFRISWSGSVFRVGQSDRRVLFMAGSADLALSHTVRSATLSWIPYLITLPRTAFGWDEPELWLPRRALVCEALVVLGEKSPVSGSHIHFHAPSAKLQSCWTFKDNPWWTESRCALRRFLRGDENPVLVNNSSSNDVPYLEQRISDIVEEKVADILDQSGCWTHNLNLGFKLSLHIDVALYSLSKNNETHAVTLFIYLISAKN